MPIFYLPRDGELAYCLYQDLENPAKMEIVKESIADLTPSLDLTNE